MSQRLFSSILLFSPCISLPVLTFKTEYWSHSSGMFGALVGVLVSFLLSSCAYYSDGFSKDFLVHRGATNRRTYWTAVCGVESNAELWLVCLVEGYWLGLNAGTFFQSLDLTLEVALGIGVFSGVAVVCQVLWIVGFCYAPMLKFIGFSKARMYSPVESILCAATAIVMGEFLGCAFGAYATGVYVLGNAAKHTVFVYVLGLYAVFLGVLGLLVTLRGLYYFCIQSPSPSLDSLELP